jgi:peptidyl-dipeptidase A
MTTVVRLAFGLLVAAIPATISACRVSAPSPARSAEEAAKFITSVNETMLQLGREERQASWVAETYITPDTEAISARANQAYIDAVARNAKDGARFNSLQVGIEVSRQLELLKTTLVVVTPSDKRQAEELTRLTASMEAAYGRGKWCKDPAQQATCVDIEQITEEIASSRDAARLRELWEGWHTISIPMKKDYARFVELSNRGAKELGFADTGALWRAKYDMAPDAFTRELDRLWDQVRPLYLSLHAYVRMKLRAKYGDIVPEKGPIPAYLMGNIWAQDWSNLLPLVASGAGGPAYSLTDILKRRSIGAVEMAKTGERFFTSLGFAPLPPTFWERSMLVKPEDRNVVCHASAWDVDLVEDLRIKMCIDPTEEDFSTIHHELGHNFYQRAYNTLPILFRGSANDGFHEAVGDTIALSVTPEYLVKIGLLDKAPDASGDIDLLLARALEKIAFLPFGLLVDQWRWQVFSGQVPPDQYNKAWWDLRLRYQGVAPPEIRGEQFFDPGAKYHVPAVTPYTRYFLASILQFQFHRALAKLAGCTGPLHRCSIYESKVAGARLEAMLRLGLSKPWPEALERLTGSRDMDATALRDYFAPLQTWLDEQTKGQPIGW